MYHMDSLKRHRFKRRSVNMIVVTNIYGARTNTGEEKKTGRTNIGSGHFTFMGIVHVRITSLREIKME